MSLQLMKPTPCKQTKTNENDIDIEIVNEKKEILSTIYRIDIKQPSLLSLSRQSYADKKCDSNSYNNSYVHKKGLDEAIIKSNGNESCGQNNKDDDESTVVCAYDKEKLLITASQDTTFINGEEVEVEHHTREIVMNHFQDTEISLNDGKGEKRNFDDLFSFSSNTSFSSITDGLDSIYDDDSSTILSDYDDYDVNDSDDTFTIHGTIDSSRKMTISNLFLLDSEDVKEIGMLLGLVEDGEYPKRVKKTKSIKPFSILQQLSDTFISACSCSHPKKTNANTSIEIDDDNNIELLLEEDEYDKLPIGSSMNEINNLNMGVSICNDILEYSDENETRSEDMGKFLLHIKRKHPFLTHDFLCEIYRDLLRKAKSNAPNEKKDECLCM